MQKFHKDQDAVSPVIAVILMVAITVVLAATVFVLVSDIGNQNKPAPQISWAKDSSAATLTVTSASDNDLKWSDFTVTGCVNGNAGNVTAGDTLTACAGSVKIVYRPANTLVYETVF
jgi:flagellin-like protein